LENRSTTYDPAQNRVWETAPYGPEFAAQVIALCRDAWGDIEITDPAYLSWQYQENSAGATTGTVAIDKASGRVIGHFGIVPVRVWVDGEERLAGNDVNAVTDPMYRRRGVFIGTVEAAHELSRQAGVSLFYAMPNEESSFHGFTERLGYHFVGHVPLLARPVNVRRLVATRVSMPGIAPLAAMFARPFAPPLPERAEPVAGIAVAPVERFDAAFDAFWVRVRGRERIMVARDIAYLNWRFVDIPLRRYESFAATEGGELRGFIVLREAEVLGMRAGLVVDFLTEPSAAGERAGRALVSHALARFAPRDLDLLTSLMLPHAQEYRLLRDAAFRPVPRPLLPIHYRLVTKDGAVARERRNWFLTMGDYDVV